MQLVSILTAAFLLSSCSFVLGQFGNFYRLSEWRVGTCTKSCGGGKISRTRRCLSQGGSTVLLKLCMTSQFNRYLKYMRRKNVKLQLQSYKLIHIGRCNVQSCPIVPIWGEWNLGICSVTCGEGQRRDTRVCSQGDCVGSTTRYVECVESDCPVERKSLEDLFKIGTWKRYKTDGEEELFIFHGAEPCYDYFENVYIKMEKTDDAIIETYTRGVHKIVTTITGGILGHITIDFGGGNPPFKANTVEVIDEDLIITLEMGEVTQIKERKYQGENEFIETTRFQSGYKTCVAVDYFRKVPEVERKSLEDLFKYGTWKRYRTDGEEELFKFLGYEQYYDYLKNLDVYITMEKTEDGIIETYTRGAHDVVTTISGENLDKYTIDFGDGTPFEVNTEEDIDDDLIITFEKDGITRIHEREYQGENEFIATLTLKRGDETFVAVDYFRKVPKVEDLFKNGTWKRYKTDGEEELFKFLGAEQYYDHVKKLDVYIKMEKTENGIVQIYTRGLHKIVTTITGEKLNQATIDDGNGDPFQFNTVEAIDDDLIITFEKDGITHIQEREYQGENEFIEKLTLKRGDETCVTIDYFRKVPEGLDYTKLIGLWKRYRVDEEEELYRFFGAEEYYHLLKDLEVYIKIEKTDEGFLETYTSGATKVVTTITGENNDQVTIDFGDGKPIQFGPDDNGTFEKDGILRTHRRELHGTHYFISTNTFKKGDETHVTVDYFRKVD